MAPSALYPLEWIPAGRDGPTVRIRRMTLLGPICHTGRGMSEDEVERLVRQARDGDPDAAGELLRRYGDRVRAAIRGRLAPNLRRRFETEDVFQSAVALSLQDLRGLDYQGEKAFVAWLTTVAERRLLGTARKHRAARRDVGRDVALEGAAGVSAGLTSPLQGAERAEVRADIERAIARLPDPERRAIQLRSYEGLSFREIAELMGLANKHNLIERALAVPDLVRGSPRMRVLLRVANVGGPLEQLGDLERRRSLCEDALSLYESRDRLGSPCAIGARGARWTPGCAGCCRQGGRYSSTAAPSLVGDERSRSPQRGQAQTRLPGRARSGGVSRVDADEGQTAPRDHGSVAATGAEVAKCWQLGPADHSSLSAGGSSARQRAASSGLPHAS